MYALFDKYYRAKQKSTEFKIDWNQFTGKMINKSVLRVHSDVHFQGKRRFYIHKLMNTICVFPMKNLCETLSPTIW